MKRKEAVEFVQQMEMDFLILRLDGSREVCEFKLTDSEENLLLRGKHIPYIHGRQAGKQAGRI